MEKSVLVLNPTLTGLRAHCLASQAAKELTIHAAM